MGLLYFLPIHIGSGASVQFYIVHYMNSYPDYAF